MDVGKVAIDIRDLTKRYKGKGNVLANEKLSLTIN